MFAFDYHLLGSVGEKVLKPSLGLASDTIETNFNKRRLCGTLSKVFEKSSRITSLATSVNFTCKVVYHENLLCFTGTPSAETMLSVVVIAV